MRYAQKQTAAQTNQLSLSTKFPAQGARAIFTLLLAACTLMMHATAFAVTLSKQADEFSRYYLINPTACIPPSVNVIENIRTYRNLGAVTSCSGFNPVRGWFEYDFNIPATGWYKLDVGPHSIYEIYIDSQFVDPNNYTNPNGPDFDPTKYDTYLGGLYTYGTYGINSSVGNVWLTRGTHRVRLQNYLWTGFPATTSVSLISAPDQALAKNVRAAWKFLTSNAQPVTRTIHRVNQCQPLEIFWGGARTNTSYLNIFVKERFTGAPIKSDTVRISSTSGQKKTTYNVPCSQEGYYTVSFGENGTPINTDDVLSLNYEVINTANQPWSGGEVNKTQVGAEIDCAAVDPHYQSADGWKRITQPFGTYLESGTRSWRNGTPSGADASWYAYTLPNLTPQTPHLVEVDYPDDALRTFVIVLRESKPLNDPKYSVAGGVDSGGEFSLSNKMLTHSLLFWPRASDPRLVFVNVREGRRGAACSKIRVYRVNGNLPELLPAKTTGRRFVNWYEEGRNFIGMYNPDYPDMYHDPRVFRDAADRWTQALAYMGGDTLSPSAAVYEGDIYPSRYNLALAPPSADDILRRIFLVAEKRGMKVLPELHPRGDAASWPYVNKPDPKRNLLVFKDGTTPRLNGAVNGPYNPIYPANQNWYLAMIGELIDRYKDSPALLGVNLRIMKWADSIYNNFHSLDYGYDDYTVNLFNQETGSNIALGSPTDPGRFMQRYTALTSGANRDRWIAWRSDKIAQLYTAIRNRVRQARPDLKVYTAILEYFNEPTLLKEAGIDVDKLKQIDGVVVVNAMRGYGRNPTILDNNGYFPHDSHGPNGDVAFQKHRDSVLDPVAMNATASATTSASFLDPAIYFEHGAIPSADDLKFPPMTPATVVSAVVNPAGRHYLERYAVQLAETDTAWMGDGGNAYTIGQPLLREFMQEYRRLPEARFTKRNDATEPVAVWELTQSAGYYFYAVNRERYPVTVKIQLSGQVVSLASGQPMSMPNSLLTLSMKPYELRAFKGSAGVAISSVTQTIPAADLQLVTDQVVFLETNPWVANLGDAAALATWNAKKQQARAELNAGHYWRARLIVESHELLQIYNRIGYPPRLRDNGSATAESATVFENFETWQPGTVTSGFPTEINGWSIRGGSAYSVANVGSPQNQVLVLSPDEPSTWHTAGKPHQVSVANGAIEISGQIALNSRNNSTGQIWLSDALQNGYGIYTYITNGNDPITNRIDPNDSPGNNKASIVKFRDSTVPFVWSPGVPIANWAVPLGEHYTQTVKVGGGFASDFIGFIEFHLRLEQAGGPGTPVTLTLWFTGSNLADTSYANPAQRLVDDGSGRVFNNGAGGGPVIDLANLTHLAFTGQSFSESGQTSLPLVRWNNLNVLMPAP